MLIQRVEVESLESEDLQAEMASGMVALTSDDTCLTVLCTVPRMIGKSAATLRDRLVAEALRQVRRMPEYRAGQSKLTLAPGVAA